MWRESRWVSMEGGGVTAPACEADRVRLVCIMTVETSTFLTSCLAWGQRDLDSHPPGPPASPERDLSPWLNCLPVTLATRVPL